MKTLIIMTVLLTAVAAKLTMDGYFDTHTPKSCQEDLSKPAKNEKQMNKAVTCVNKFIKDKKINVADAKECFKGVECKPEDNKKKSKRSVEETESDIELDEENQDVEAEDEVVEAVDSEAEAGEVRRKRKAKNSDEGKKQDDKKKPNKKNDCVLEGISAKQRKCFDEKSKHIIGACYKTIKVNFPNEVDEKVRKELLQQKKGGVKRPQHWNKVFVEGKQQNHKADKCKNKKAKDCAKAALGPLTKKHNSAQHQAEDKCFGQPARRSKACKNDRAAVNEALFGKSCNLDAKLIKAMNKCDIAKKVIKKFETFRANEKKAVGL